jgi:hypothetical protein
MYLNPIQLKLHVMSFNGLSLVVHDNVMPKFIWANTIIEYGFYVS